MEKLLRRREEIEERVEEVAMEVHEERESRNAPFWVRWKEYYFSGGEDEALPLKG